MASPGDLMDFDKAVEYMESMHVKDYLHMISGFLKKNNRELFFPNISAYDEAFLVNLAKDTRNLKKKTINHDPENRSYVLEIIETLEINRDIFRWTYTYENGKTNKNLLVYKKIFTNKINMKPAEFKKPPSLSLRLRQPQSAQPAQQTQNSQTQPTSKIQLLNMTLRFIKNDTERTLQYPEMPLINAQYIYSLITNPKRNLSVGFGYKSLGAPLFEAMDAFGEDYEFKIGFVETGKCETVSLKMEKVPRNNSNNTSRDDASVASSSSSTRLPKNKRKKINGVTVQFVTRTLRRLLKYTGEVDKVSVSFDQLADEEMAFVRGVKNLAASTESYGVFEEFRASLLKLNTNIAEVLKTCKIRIEEGQHKRLRGGYVTLYKVPREFGVAITPVSEIQSKSTGNPPKQTPEEPQKQPASKLKPKTLQDEKTEKYINPIIMTNLNTNKEYEFIDEYCIDRIVTHVIPAINSACKTPVAIRARAIRILFLMRFIEFAKCIEMTEREFRFDGKLSKKMVAFLEDIVLCANLRVRSGFVASEELPWFEHLLAAADMFFLSLSFDSGGYMTLYKVPREVEPAITGVSAEKRVTRSQSLASAKSPRDRSLSKTRQIEFKSGGQLISKHKPHSPQPDEADQSDQVAAVAPETTDSPRSGRSSDRLNKRQTKLLEDMATPIESDRARRMMLLMGWKGGALGARGDGILEPLVPTIELPAGAGLGHVPPPKAPKAPKGQNTPSGNTGEFREALLQNILDLLLNEPDTKHFEYKTELSKKDSRFVNNAVQAFNGRKTRGLCWKVDPELVQLVLAAMRRRLEVQLAADVAPDLKNITLSKSTSNLPKQTQEKAKKQPASLKVKPTKPPKDAKTVKDINPIIMTNLKTNKEYEFIDEDCIDRIVAHVMPAVNSGCKTPVATRARAIRILFLMRFTEFAKCIEMTEREFRFDGTPQKKMVAFLQDVVSSVNLRVRSGFVTSAELPWFQQLLAAADLFCLSLSVDSGRKFILKKKHRNLTQYQKRFTNSAMPAVDNNNDLRANDHNLAKGDWANEQDESYESAETVTYYHINEVAEYPLENDSDKDQTEAEVENVSNCDIDYIDAEDTEAVVVKEEVEGEIDEDSLCVCDNRVDISQLDKGIRDLELALCQAEISITKDDEDDRTSISKRSRCSSEKSDEKDLKRTKLSHNDIFVIITTDNNEDIDTDVIKEIQTRILKGVDNSDDFLPLLKCFGVQHGGLVYSCHDENDIGWLENIVGDFDLKTNRCDDDFCLDRKSLKMVMKINSFIPLEFKKVLRSIELYNDGLYTSKWKVITEQRNSDSVLFIIEVDEKSFEYISAEDFALYIGIDKAQFSIIF